jgi:biopolymer transport protein ExbD
MRNWPQRRKRQARIEIIPMIDVMMFLLVFFVLISINVLPALGLKINPPTSNRTETVIEKKKVMLAIDRDGNMALDGNAVDADSLAGKLQAMQDAAKVAGQQMTVVIAGDGDSALQHLVVALDAMRAAGITGSAIVTKQK